MSPEDVRPEWVVKAVAAMHGVDLRGANPYGVLFMVQQHEEQMRKALAAVLPEAMAEALAKYLDAYVEAQPRMGDSNAAFAVLREMAAEVNRLREGGTS